MKDVAARSCTITIVIALLLSCARADREARQYSLTGQIVALGAGRQDVTVKHDDIPRFMPAMTMAYRVSDPAQLDGLTPGDTIAATLNVRESEAWLSAIRRTGHADLAAGAAPPHVMDVLERGELVPDDVLEDEHRRPRRLTDWRGHAVAVTFIYSRCPMPEFCPLMERQFADVQKGVDADPSLRDRVRLVAITFDPGHDTPDVLAAHARARGADPRIWTYLTGTPPAIEHVASRFGVSVVREGNDAAAIVHNLRTAIIDADGRVVKIYSGNEWTPVMLVDDLRSASGRG